MYTRHTLDIIAQPLLLPIVTCKMGHKRWYQTNMQPAPCLNDDEVHTRSQILCIVLRTQTRQEYSSVWPITL